MGTGPKKGYAHRWIPNHLQDAQRRVVPRSMLNLLGYAAEQELRRPLARGKRLLAPQDLAEALTETSRRRVSELQEEYRLVQRLENLRGRRLLLEQGEVIDLLGTPVPGEAPGLTTEGEAVLDELVRLGVISVRLDKRIDVPDIYRYGFGIKRKGGVARPR